MFRNKTRREVQEEKISMVTFVDDIVPCRKQNGFGLNTLKGWKNYQEINCD